MPLRVAICSDEIYPIHDLIIDQVKSRGYEVSLFGALAIGLESCWVATAEQAAQAIVSGDCCQGIFFCWSGTGICMAANKVPGIRAALCGDAETARAARIWNHANVLALSNRLLSQDVAKEILTAWFETPLDAKGEQDATALKALDERYRGRFSG
jgi:ribose 5-phosphate isomerase B